MTPLRLEDLVDIDAYEAVRDDYRARLVAHKRTRRLAVGEHVTLIFENRETLRFQVQEMLRVERIREPRKAQVELDVYNELMPGDGELSATLMIEITDLAHIRSELDRLVGLDEYVNLCLGTEADEQRIRARFDAKQFEADRIAAVQYLKFALDARARDALRDPDTRAALSIEHEHYRHTVELPSELRESLVADLAGDPEPLLDPARVPAAGGAEILYQDERVRVRRPAQAAGPGHVTVEPVAPVVSWLDADDALSAALLAVVRDQARRIHASHGSCRVLCDIHGPRLRWHVFAVPC